MAKTRIKPFEHDPKLMAASLSTAADMVVEAISILRKAQHVSENWGEYETVGHFAHLLEEFMSSDHGEADFLPYLEKAIEKLTSV